MKKRILIVLAILAVPVMAYAANVGLGEFGILLPHDAGRDSDDCDADREGLMYYDTVTDRAHYCNGADYKKMVNQ
jgi:hypothetical protein